MSEINVMRELILPAFTKHSARIAIDFAGQKFTYGTILIEARKLARTLKDMGVKPGISVAIMLENSARYAVADLAIILLGAAKTPINMMLSNEEILYILKDSGSKVCIVDSSLGETLQKVNDAHIGAEIIYCGNDIQKGITWQEALAVDEIGELPEVAEDDESILMYTGGTTGLPKGVVHTQKGATLNMLSHIIEMEISGSDKLLLNSPLPHSAGFLMQAAFVKGAEVYLQNSFDVEKILDLIEKDKISYLFMVPTMMYRLFDAVEERKRFDAGSVNTILYGAAPITQNRLEQGLSIFGQVFMQLFAQTEAPNFLTKLAKHDHEVGALAHRLKSCGQAVAMAEVKTVNEDGADCAPGEVGEVVASAPYLMRGYLGKPEATEEALRNGWLYTGDIGYFDRDGYLYLVDRKKDMIISGGLNVYSSEVEQKIALIEGVEQVAVVGIPDPDWGEKVVAVVVFSGSDIDHAEKYIKTESAKHLSSYKRPKQVLLVDSFPLTAVGKVDKKVLRKQITH